LLLPLPYSNDVSNLRKLLLVMLFIDSFVDLFLEIFKVVIHASHKVFEVALELIIVGVIGEGKLLNLSHILPDLFICWQVWVLNER
jgi:hypothetical protein